MGNVTRTMEGGLSVLVIIVIEIVQLYAAFKYMAAIGGGDGSGPALFRK
jgi:hypothetical protein